MGNENDLLLLLLNLSQMHDRKRIVELFLDSISALFSPRTFQHRDQKPASGVVSFPVDTRKSKFGYIVTADGEALSEKDRSLIHNATQMLAILLERLAFEGRIEKERTLVQEKADKRLLKIRAEQREKELILSNLAELIAFLDPDMRIIWANSKIIERHNLFDVEYIGQKCYELYHQFDQPCPDCPVVDTLKTGETCTGIHRSPDGLYWQSSGIPVRDENDKIIGAMETALNITDIVTSRQELQANLSLLRIAGDTAKFGGWSVDLNTNRVTWSDQVATIHEMQIGYSPLVEEGIRFYAPEWRERIAAVFSACTEEGIPYDEEMEITTAKGRRVWVRTIGEAVKDDQGKIIKIQGAFQDITDRKQAEEEIRTLNTELEQRVKDRTTELEAVNKELESFAYSISHDFRAPLRALDAFSANLTEKYSDQLDEQGLHYLNRIRNAAIYMSNLVDDLLKLSRITRTDIKKDRLDLSKMAAEVMAELQESEPTRKVEISIVANLSAEGDPHLLRAAMYNLLGNAWKFSSKEPQAEIEVGQTVVDEEKVFFVCDNGVGFNMTYADNLFGAFQRLHGVDEFPGTGIGLATVQRIINRHGGRVWATSEVGKGATFFFTLKN